MFLVSHNSNKLQNSKVLNEMCLNMPIKPEPKDTSEQNELKELGLHIADLNSDLNDKVTLNIGGKKFVTLKHTLINIPTTKLGRLTTDDASYDSDTGEFFIDRNPKIFQSILDLHRTGELHLPFNVCSIFVKAELDFWNVSEDYISECCWKTYSLHNQDLKIAAVLDERMGRKDEELILDSRKRTIQQSIWLTIEFPNYNWFAKVWHCIYIIMVLMSIIVFCLTTIPEYRLNDSTENQRNISTSDPFYKLTHTHPIDALFYLDMTCMLFFILELPLRITTCPNKRAFLKDGLNQLDIFLVMVMIVAFGIDLSPAFKQNDPLLKEIEAVVRLFLALRVFRIFHLARRYPTIKILHLTVRASLRELLLLLVGLTMTVIIFATFAFLAESMSHSEKFTSIPHAIWWAVITMTTVGYGDVYPVTAAGRSVGILCALAGLLLLSMPIAIIAQNFGAYYSNLTVREERMARESKREIMKVRNANESLRIKLTNILSVSQKIDNTSPTVKADQSKKVPAETKNNPSLPPGTKNKLNLPSGTKNKLNLPSGTKNQSLDTKRNPTTIHVRENAKY